MKCIELTGGAVAIVDDEDFAEVAQYRWFLAKIGYAIRNGKRIGGKKAPSQYMHRVIMKAQKGQICDHINGNKLDNRKCNLRFVTNSQNRMNKGVQSNNKLGEKNIHYVARKRRFVVQVMVNRKNAFHGYFKTLEEARLARDLALAKHHGEHAFIP